MTDTPVTHFDAARQVKDAEITAAHARGDGIAEMTRTGLVGQNGGARDEFHASRQCCGGPPFTGR